MSVRALGVRAAVVVTCACLAPVASAGLVPDLPVVPDPPDVPALPAPELPEPGVPGLPEPGVPGLPADPLEPVAAAPIAFTGGAEQVGADRAVLTGLVVPGGAPVTYAFEYGPTDRYGALTPAVSLPAGGVALPVRATIAGLAPQSAIHFRLVARSATGTSAGQDRVVVTQPGGASQAALGRQVRGERPGALVRVTPAAGPGAVTGLAIATRSGSAAVTGLRADLGERGGYVAELACRQDARGRAPASGPLGPRGDGTFALGYAFRRAGAHDVTFELLGGGCGGPARVLRTLRSRVTPTAVAAVTARTAQASPASQECPDTGLLPRRGTEARVERAVLCLLVRERAAAGLGTLIESPKLRRAARSHLADMLRFRFLAHRRRGGPSLARRLRAVRYDGRAGETINLGTGRLSTPAATVRAWMGSTVHRDVLLRDGYRAVGLAVRRGTPIRVPGEAATYTAVLGSRR